MAETYSQLMARAFADSGITDAFVVTGGAIAPFTSSISEQGRISMHYMLNEQAAGVAAEAYGFYDGRPCLLIVTSGPGVTNCLTAIAAAYTNSAPVIVVSGQARVQDIKFAESHKVRQVGNQHLHTREIVSTITKKFYEPTEQVDCYELVKDLIENATDGRKGPTWLSFPIDLQRQDAHEDQFSLESKEVRSPNNQLASSFDRFLFQLENSQKPVFLIGNGARESIHAVITFAKKFRIPILTTWPGMDLISDDDDLYLGRPGSLPSSWLPNKVNFYSDFLIIVGARLDLPQLGYNMEDFARTSVVWRIDSDEEELKRFEGSNWNNINSKSSEFSRCLDTVKSLKGLKIEEWWKQIQEWKKNDRLPGTVNQKLVDGLSTYRVVQFLSRELNPKVVVTGSSGTCIEMLLQTWRVSSGQRIVNSCGLGSMGFAVPGAIGVSHKISNKELICIESDGSFAMSLQEVYTVVMAKRNIKIIILDSRGYKSILLSQSRTGQHLHGFDKTSGVSLPNIELFARSLGIRYRKISRESELNEETLDFINCEEACILQIMVSARELPLPKLVSSSSKGGNLVAPKLIDLQPQME